MSDAIEAGSPSETAAWLAGLVGSLDRLARWAEDRTGSHYDQVVAYTLGEFVDAFRSARRRVFPLLGAWVRDDDVSIGRTSATSYHSLACHMAISQFGQIWFYLEPKAQLGRVEEFRPTLERYLGDEFTVDDAIRDWDRVADGLRMLFDDVDSVNGEWLSNRIAQEFHRARAAGKQPPPQRDLPVVTLKSGGADIAYGGIVDNDVDLTAAECLQLMLDKFPHVIGIGHLCNGQPARAIARLPERLRARCVSEGTKGYRFEP